jgi:hypothetical protein
VQHRGCVDAEFVVAASEGLYEPMPGDDHPGGSVALESAHRPEAGLQSAVVTFDPVVRVPVGVVERVGQDVLDDVLEGRSEVGHNLRGLAVSLERLGEEAACRGDCRVALRGTRR